ncbi:MAG: hypothetical protein KJN92_08480, partial [Gemmatimonadetes bacterium]|nr:hypothetical protein [Gemmatimonadota bacterium]
PYKGFEGAVRSGPWLASPFLDRASVLTYLFSQVPLAPSCPSCQKPLALEPWEFQDLTILIDQGIPNVRTVCGLCRTEILLDLVHARATLRLGLSIVTDAPEMETSAHRFAVEIDRLGGPRMFLEGLAGAGLSLGELDAPVRTGLIMSLDDLAELDALEAEWRAAEEMAAIMDGELTRVEGIDAFLATLGLEPGPDG